MRLLFMVLLLGRWCGAADATPVLDPAAVADAKHAADLFHGAIEGKELPKADQAVIQAIIQKMRENGEKASFERERKMLAPLVGLPEASPQGITKELSDVLIESTLQERNLAKTPDPAEAVSVGPIISNPSDLSLAQRAKTVVIFWSKDSRNDGLAGKINRLMKARPDLAVYDSHLCPLKVWYATIKQTKQRLDRSRLEGAAHLGDPAAMKRIQNEVLGIAEEWRGFTDMCKFRRTGGYAIIDDTALAKAFHVDQVPSIRYVTHRGVVHRLDGLAEDVELTAWCDRVDTWETNNLAGELQRVFP